MYTNKIKLRHCLQFKKKKKTIYFLKISSKNRLRKIYSGNQEMEKKEKEKEKKKASVQLKGENTRKPNFPSISTMIHVYKSIKIQEMTKNQQRYLLNPTEMELKPCIDP